MSDVLRDEKYEQIIDDLVSTDYAITDDFFSPEELAKLRGSILTKYEEAHFRSAAIGKLQEEKVLKMVRSDAILWIDEAHMDAVEEMFFRKVNDLISYLNQTCYLGIGESEFHYAVYPVGTFYRRHLDTFRNDQRRTLSVVLYLNDEDWKDEYGGQLRLFLPNPDGNETTLDILPTLGRLVIFDSRKLEHEVQEVQRTRYSITGWLKTQPNLLAM